VVHDAGGLVENFPAALPGEKAEVRVFQIEGREQGIEAAEFEKLAAIEGAGSAASIEAGEEAAGAWIDCRIFTMAHPETTILPPALGESRFFAALCGIAEEYLAGDRKHALIGEAGEKRSEEIG